jgi:hypothetical protein
MSVNVPEPDVTQVDAEQQDDAVIGRALRWSLVVFVMAGVIIAAVVYVVTRPPKVDVAIDRPLPNVGIRETPPVPLPYIPFVNVTRESGITFVHENGAYGDKLLPETMGGGVAFWDYDGDDDPDILFVNSQRWSGDTQPSKHDDKLALYQNDGRGHFVDVTEGSGLDISLFGMGVAIGDYDSDGRPDVFISAVGPSRLFHNEGGGKFADVTEAMGVAGPADGWGTSCGWFDYDNDRDLDLFVCHYVKWSRDFDLAQDFQLTGGGRAYGRPQNFNGTFPVLYRNDASRFTDVSAEAGLQIRYPATGVPVAKSLGVTFADLDDDGWMDILVANDTVQNFLFHNQGNRTFKERAMDCNIAFDSDGRARGAMGIVMGWVRNNDERCIVIGNFALEPSALYVSKDNQMQFVDEAVPSGLGPTTRPFLKFGVLLLDIDLDGRLDYCAANGHLEEEIHRVLESQHYEQPPQIFWNGGTKYATEFIQMPIGNVGEDFLSPMVGRGATMADIDKDGDLDVLLTASGREPRLLRNDQKLGNHWLRVKLTGTKCNRDAIGSWIELHVGKHVMRRQIMPTASYLSQLELPVTFGLGTRVKIDKLVVHWADGSVQEVTPPDVDQSLHIDQSSDAAPASEVAAQ